MDQGTIKMNVMNFFKNFAKDESGAVTVDFVVLTAGIVGLGILIVTQITGPIENAAGVIATDINSAAALGRN